MLNSFQTTNIPDAGKIVAIHETHMQGTTKSPELALNNNNLDNVLNFWSQFRQNKEFQNPSIITTTAAAPRKKQSASPLFKNTQLEKPKMSFEEENASRITELVNTNNDYSIEKPQLTLTTGQPKFIDQFKEYAAFFDVMYKQFLGLQNQQKENQDRLKNGLSIVSDIESIRPKDNPMSTENYQQRLSNIALSPRPPSVQSAMSIPIHILHVKPLKINFMQSETTKEPEKNGTQLYSETVKEIANEVKAMLLAQLKKEIPLITLNSSTEAPKTTIVVPIISQELPKTIQHSVGKGILSFCIFILFFRSFQYAL